MEILYLPSLSVSIDSAEHEKVSAYNADYEALILKKTLSESFIAQHSQTMPATEKSREVQAQGIFSENVCVQVSPFEIHAATPEPDEAERISMFLKQKAESSMNFLVKSPCTLLHPSPQHYPPPIESESIRKKKIKKKEGHSINGQSATISRRSSFLSESGTETQEDGKTGIEPLAISEIDQLSENLPISLHKSAKLVEKILCQNSYHKEQMIYRNFPSIEQENSGLYKLFSFYTESLSNFSISTLEWSTHNSDLLAVGYRNKKTSETQGQLLFWSLKNPNFPEKTIFLNSGVSCIAFSHIDQFLLGLDDGSITVWDIKKFQSESCPIASKKIHTAPVFGIRWMDQSRFISVGGDGSVIMWSFKKELEGSIIHKSHRFGNDVFRDSQLLCVELSQDPTVYFTGASDGTLKKCSTIYTEKELSSIPAHSGSISCISSNPFCQDLFLTASSDWSVKLWNTKDVSEPVTCLQSIDLCDAINDLTWHPKNSSCFALAADDGRVELWDLSRKALDPIYTYYGNISMTSLRYSPNAPVIAAGDCDGKVHVIRVIDSELPLMSIAEQQSRVRNCLSK